MPKDKSFIYKTEAQLRQGSKGTHGTGKIGKILWLINTNSLQGKLGEFENFAKLREFQSDIFLNLLIIILLNYDM